MSNLLSSLKSQPFDIRKIFDEFKKPIHSNLFYKNKQGLINDSDKVFFQVDKWECNPLQFCKDYYGQQYIYPIVMVVNTLSSMFDFIPDNFKNRYIFAPKINSIMKVLSNAKE